MAVGVELVAGVMGSGGHVGVCGAGNVGSRGAEMAEGHGGRAVCVFGCWYVGVMDGKGVTGSRWRLAGGWSWPVMVGEQIVGGWWGAGCVLYGVGSGLAARGM